MTRTALLLLSFNLCHALLDGAEDRLPAMLDEVAPHLLAVTCSGADRHPSKRGWPQLIQPLNQPAAVLAETATGEAKVEPGKARKQKSANP